MNKKLLNKILPYCGHGLKAIYEDNIVDVSISSSGTWSINTERLLTKGGDGAYHYKPILFPPDCLNRKITTEYGKEIPTIKMAKIAFPKIERWRIEICRAQSDYAYFFFNGSDFVSGYYKTFTVENQWKLFQYLYSRHIAFNLKPDEYISVESLEKNPYVE